MGTVKEELPLCSPKVVNLYELALLPLTFLMSLPDPQFPKGLFTVTHDAFEVESVKLSMQLPFDPSLPGGGLGFLLLSGDFNI